MATSKPEASARTVKIPLPFEQVHHLTFAVQVIDPVLRFEVYGLPITQGSKRMGRTKHGAPVMFEDRAALLRPWRESVAWTAQQAVMKARREGYSLPFDAPVLIVAKFYLPRPKSRKGPNMLPDRKPDADKLLRAVGDAMKGIVYVDDSRIVRAFLAKDYGDPGATITAARMVEAML